MFFRRHVESAAFFKKNIFIVVKFLGPTGFLTLILVNLVLPATDYQCIYFNTSSYVKKIYINAKYITNYATTNQECMTCVR